MTLSDQWLQFTPKPPELTSDHREGSSQERDNLPGEFFFDIKPTGANGAWP
jgi:hypothetical protein